MKVSLADIRAISSLLYDYLEQSGRQEFEIEEDYYWEIPEEHMYDPANDPKDFTLGQLSFDWDDLKSMLKDQNEHPPIGYGLVWLSSIIRVIGQRSGY